MTIKYYQRIIYFTFMSFVIIKELRLKFLFGKIGQEHRMYYKFFFVNMDRRESIPCCEDRDMAIIVTIL